MPQATRRPGTTTTTPVSATATRADQPTAVLPDTIQAIRQEVLGEPDVLELAEIPRPEPRPTEVRVRVTAAGVNPLDWRTRATGVFLGQPPFTVGRVTDILVGPDRTGLEAIAELADRGRLRVHVAQTFPLAQPARAHEVGETGQIQGKLVLTID
jgi:NADPH:quinone reductase-like Zn-dependent oxidoreductase